jgi:homoserine acetyltransferase
MIPSNTDILIYPYNSQEFVEAVNNAGENASLFEVQTKDGHIGGLTDILKAGERIKSFLAD